MLDGRQGTDDTVFMKAVAPPGAAIIGSPAAIDLAVPLLCLHGGGREQRVFVIQTADDAARMTQLEARLANLEGRVANLESAKSMRGGMTEKGMGGPMGTMPQPAAPMPPADAGMGHM